VESQLGRNIIKGLSKLGVQPMEQRKLIKLKGEIREMNCNEIYEQFKNFIYKTAHSFLNSGENIDDLIQIGNIGLVKAFNSYRVESENLFMTYLAIVVNNQILMHLRKIKKLKNEMSFEDHLTTDADGNFLTLLEVIKEPADCEEIVFKNIADIELKKFISELRPVNKKILELFFFSNMEQRKIGKELNFSQSYISRLLKQSLKILKNKYERNEYLMTKKEECYKFFNENDSKPRQTLINLAVTKFGISEATARTYYPTWRKEFMAKPGYVDPSKNGKQEKVNNITKSSDNITETAKKITEVAEKSPINVNDIPESKPTFVEMKDAIKDINIVETVKEPIIPDIDIAKIVSDAFAEVKQTFNENSEKIFAEAKEHAAIRNEKLISEVKETINPKTEGINWKADVMNPIEVDKEDILVVSRLVPIVMAGDYGNYEFSKTGVRIAAQINSFITKGKMDEALEALAIWERCYGKEGEQVC